MRSLPSVRPASRQPTTLASPKRLLALKRSRHQSDHDAPYVPSAYAETREGDDEAPRVRTECPAISVCFEQLISELEDGVPLRDCGRIYGCADVFLDPLGSAS